MLQKIDCASLGRVAANSFALSLLSLSAAIALCAAPAAAQDSRDRSEPPRESMEQSAGHHPMARGHAQPPTGFDPLSASDAKLAQFGFPPRPDAQSAPDRYAVWKKLVTAPQQRLQPALEHTTIHNGRAHRVSPGAAGPGPAATRAPASSTTRPASPP